MKAPVAVGRRDGALVKNESGGETFVEDNRIKKVLQMLDEIEKTEQENWKTGQAMPLIHRKLKRAVSRAEIMSHAWGRIKLARQIREMLTK